MGWAICCRSQQSVCTKAYYRSKSFRTDIALGVTGRSDNSVMVEKDVTVAAREIHQITRNTFEPKRFLESEVIDGDTKRTTVEIRLDTEDLSALPTCCPSFSSSVQLLYLMHHHLPKSGYWHL